jgi:hypothetical protein
MINRYIETGGNTNNYITLRWDRGALYCKIDSVKELAQDFVQRGHDVRNPPDGGVVDQPIADLAV